MKKHNCKDWFEEGSCCAICGNLLLKSPVKSIKALKEVVRCSNMRQIELERRIERLPSKKEILQLLKDNWSLGTAAKAIHERIMK